MSEKIRVKTQFGAITATPQQAEYLQRIERFGPPSKMASVEERRAYQAYQTIPEIQAGRATIADLPEDYGGRPQGESRRAIRMQEAYDARQAQLLQQQRAMQQIEQANIAKIREEEEYSAQQNLNVLNEKTSTQTSTEASAIASGLNSIDFKTDPEAALRVDELILNNPLGAAREDIAKQIGAAKSIIETYGMANTAKADQEAGKIKSSIINKALSEGVTEAEIEATRFADPKTAMVDYDYEKIERLAAKREGERKTKEPEEEEYKPISVAEARDRRDVVKAEFDALSSSVEGGELEDDDPDYVKTRARLNRAEAELKVAEGAKRPQAGGTQPKPKELNPRDKSALDWANANPDDPRSSKIKQRLGVD
jgi:hypothetical protein